MTPEHKKMKAIMIVSMHLEKDYGISIDEFSQSLAGLMSEENSNKFKKVMLETIELINK